MMFGTNSILSAGQLQTLGFHNCDDINVITKVFESESPYAVVLTDFNGNHHIFKREGSTLYSYIKQYEESNKCVG